MTVTAIREHLVAELSGEVVILHAENGTYYGLNQVGSRVWALIQEPRTMDDLVEAIVGEYAVEREQAEGDLHALVRDLASNGLAKIA